LSSVKSIFVDFYHLLDVLSLWGIVNIVGRSCPRVKELLSFCIPDAVLSTLILWAWSPLWLQLLLVLPNERWFFAVRCSNICICDYILCLYLLHRILVTLWERVDSPC
jgi:hypothetical protein